MADLPTPKTLTVPEAGHRYFGLARNASYEAAKRGDIPTIRVGRLLRVSVAVMERKVSAEPAATATIATAA